MNLTVPVRSWNTAQHKSDMQSAHPRTLTSSWNSPSPNRDINWKIPALNGPVFGKHVRSDTCCD
jgi:hypothetical protein